LGRKAFCPGLSGLMSAYADGAIIPREARIAMALNRPPHRRAELELSSSPPIRSARERCSRIRGGRSRVGIR